MHGQIVVTIDPTTNDMKVESNIDAAQTVLQLARAHQLALANASRIISPVQVPDAVAQRALLSNGKR